MALRVDREELLSILSALKSSLSLDPRRINARVGEFAQKHSIETTAWISTIGSLARRGQSSSKIVDLEAGDLQAIAYGFDVPRLVLDQLLSMVVQDSCITLTESDFVSIRTYIEQADDGKGIDYCIPKHRLLETQDLSISLLMIEPGAVSKWHRHPGDELNVCQQGNVEVEFRTTGLSATIGEGEFAHFYAEQEHRLINKSRETARMLTLRSLKLRDKSSREEFLDDLRTTDRLPAHTTRHLQNEFSREFTRFGERQVTFDVIQDRHGLGQLLKQACRWRAQTSNEKMTIDAIAERAEQQGLGFTRSRIDRLIRGQARVEVSDLQDLSRLFGLAPMLLFNYFSPAITTGIAVGFKHWRRVPYALLGESKARYYVPARRLAHSDTAIAVVELAPGTSTPANSHPGHEILIPLEGDFAINIDDSPNELTASQHVLGQFVSDAEHWVVNNSKSPAKFMAIRFY